jgi:hypothetical protein
MFTNSADIGNSTRALGLALYSGAVVQIRIGYQKNSRSLAGHETTDYQNRIHSVPSTMAYRRQTFLCRHRFIVSNERMKANCHPPVCRFLLSP